MSDSKPSAADLQREAGAFALGCLQTARASGADPVAIANIATRLAGNLGGLPQPVQLPAGNVRHEPVARDGGG